MRRTWVRYPGGNSMCSIVSAGPADFCLPNTCFFISIFLPFKVPNHYPNIFCFSLKMVFKGRVSATVTQVSWVSSIYACMLSCFTCVQLFVTLWTIAHQAPLSMGFSRQEQWSRLPFPPSRGSSQPRN